jgi:acetylornithine deacetylase/succinyl-diaminopimelate desuccinylase family protein
MTTIDRVLKEVQKRQRELHEILMSLIRFRTPNPPGGNEREAQLWIAAQLKKLGCKVEVFDALPGRPDAVGKLPGAGGGRSVILSGHIDVFEDRMNEKWRRDPHEPYIDGGALFGKGSTDMKGALATYIFLLSCFRQIGVRLKGDVTIASVMGEECGEPGTKRLIEKGYKADFAVVGEPTYGGTGTYPAVGIVNGRLTLESPYTLHLQERRFFLQAGGGREGANCIEKMAQVIIPALNELEKQWSIFKKHPLMPPGQAMINVFSISGGGNTFIIPDRCTIDFSVYCLPGETKEAVQKEVVDQVNRAAQADFWLRKYPPRIDWETNPDRYQFIPFDLDVDQAGVKTMMKAYKQVSGKELVVGGRGGIVDTGWFAQVGIPAMTYGPGDAYWAHRIDERIELSALATYSQTIALFLMNWCGIAE